MAKSQLIVYNLFSKCNDIFIFRNQMHVQLILKDSLQLSGRTVNYGVVVSVFPSSSWTSNCNLQLKGQFQVGICISIHYPSQTPWPFILFEMPVYGDRFQGTEPQNMPCWVFQAEGISADVARIFSSFSEAVHKIPHVRSGLPIPGRKDLPYFLRQEYREEYELTGRSSYFPQFTILSSYLFFSLSHFPMTFCCC